MYNPITTLAFAGIALLTAAAGCSSTDASFTDDPESELPERGPIGKADSSGSCYGACGGQSTGSCWCDDKCANYGDCCEDIESACDGGTPSPSGPTIRFHADFTSTVHGTLEQGATVAIDYDENRLQDCRGSQNGYAQWGIMVYYRFDDGEFQTMGIAGNVEPSSGLPTLELSHRGNLEMWFENTNSYGCHAYDSSYGANYHFQVE